MNKIGIFQVTDEKERDFAFMGLSQLKKLGKEVEKANYSQVWEGELNLSEYKNDEELCERIYSFANFQNPLGFKGRSISVSDVITVDDEAFYCDRIGFTRLNRF